MTALKHKLWGIVCTASLYDLHLPLYHQHNLYLIPRGSLKTCLKLETWKPVFDQNLNRPPGISFSYPLVRSVSP